MEPANAYSRCWTELFNILTPQSLQKILTSLFASLSYPLASDTSGKARSEVKREARLLQIILGVFGEEGRAHVDEAAYNVIFGRPWDEGVTRVFVCWAAGNRSDASLNQGSKCTFFCLIWLS